MNLVQITPGAGGMYCGGCFRDNALVAALRRAGHEALMVPLYLPLTLDEPDQSASTPILRHSMAVSKRLSLTGSYAADSRMIIRMPITTPISWNSSAQSMPRSRRCW